MVTTETATPRGRRMARSIPPLSLLRAFKLVSVPWPEVHPGDADAARWESLGEAELQREWERWLAKTNAPEFQARLFYKLVPDYRFAGGNNNFVRDSGLGSLENVVGKTDFDASLPWVRQAAWYRRHDEELVQTRGSALDILERQDQSTGTAWIHTGKTAVFGQDGSVIGVLGMYEVLDNATGTRMALARGR